MVKLQIVNPQAATSIEAVGAAPKLSSLEGKTIGLYWNLKAGGDVALDRTAELLGQRFLGTTFKHYLGSVGATLRHATAEDAERVSKECDGGGRHHQRLRLLHVVACPRHGGVREAGSADSFMDGQRFH